MVHYRWSQFLFPAEKASSLLVKSTESVVRLFARLIVKIRVAREFLLSSFRDRV